MNVVETFRFHTPSTMLIVGPSGCWKTVFTTRLLLQKRGVQFHEGVPDVKSLSDCSPRGGVLILDDLMAECSNDKNVLDLFTKHSHHLNITVLYLCQDMFPPGKYAKSISRNVHYIVAFKNPRDQLGMRNMLLEAFPHRWNAIQRTFQTVKDRPFGYLVYWTLQIQFEFALLIPLRFTRTNVNERKIPN